jgi:hypothetical protein
MMTVDTARLAPGDGESAAPKSHGYFFSDRPLAAFVVILLSNERTSPNE